MDSLPQEIVDEIIDNLPISSLHYSSLVERRWRERSQRRAFHNIDFHSEPMVNRWYRKAQRDPGGISTRVQSASFFQITRWRDPALFGRLLENFTSLTTLWTLETEIPEEILERILHGELGKRITALYLRSPLCSLSTVVYMSLSLPNLQRLCVDDYRPTPRDPPSSYPVLPRRGPLNSLYLSGYVDKVAEALANSRFTSRRLFIDFRVLNVQKLLTLSSTIIWDLMLIGMHSLCVSYRSGKADFTLTDNPDRWSSHLIDLPPFPVLTSLRMFIFSQNPSIELIDILSSMSSVPTLASISIERPCWSLPEPVPPHTWAHLDEWLTRMAKNTTIKGGPVLTLRRWPYGENLVDAFLPNFREAGKINVDPNGFDICQ